MTDRDDLRAAVEALVHQWQSAYSEGMNAISLRGVLDTLDTLLAEHPDDTPVWCSEHMEPYCPRHTEPPSDEAAMHIDPEPPGVTMRPFTDAEVAALDAEPPSGGEVTADELAEVIADGVVAYFKTISYLADTSDEGWADEHEIAKHGQARRSAAAILARFDVRRRKPAHHGAALRGGGDQ